MDEYAYMECDGLHESIRQVLAELYQRRDELDSVLHRLEQYQVSHEMHSGEGAGRKKVRAERRAPQAA